jgi:hypothetical protein
MATFVKKSQKNPNWLPQWENSPKNKYTAFYHLHRIPIIFLQFFAKHYSNHVQNHARHCANAQKVVIRGYVVFSGLMILFPKSKMDR